MKAAVTEAIMQFQAGTADKAGIDPVILLIASVKSDGDTDRESLVNGLIGAIDTLRPLDESALYCVALIVRELRLENSLLAAKLQMVLSEYAGTLSEKGLFNAWSAFRIANKGIFPADLSTAETQLKQSAPGLWLDLVLAAYSSDNPNKLTARIKELVRGSAPIMKWERLRSKLTEVRQAYRSADEFRRHVVEIGLAIESKTDRLGFFRAIDTRSGTSFAEMPELTEPEGIKSERPTGAGRRRASVLALPDIILKTESRFMKTNVSPHQAAA